MSNENEDELDWSDEEGSRIDDIFIPAPIQTSEIVKSDKRLIITKIRNQFFKSYGDEQTLGPFCQCFNAVVGPNGSGKSNVIDAILFVFGYRAAKIRSKKLSSLIHNSKKYPNVQSCHVAVHFAEIVDTSETEYEIVPGSEFYIQRTANIDNSSYYQINEKRVQFKEVASLLNGYGIDLRNNRFLILQGEVEEISMMKPKGATENETGMLEYLEDIIGTTRYKKPLEELTERIDQLSEIRLQKLNSLQLITTDLEKLKEPMEKAVGFLKDENKVATCKNFLLQKNIYEHEEKIKEIETDREKIDSTHEQLKNKLKELSDQKIAREKAFKEQNVKYDSLTKKKEKLKETFETIEKRDVQASSEMKDININRKKFKEQLAEEKKKLEKLERVPEENEQKIKENETFEKKLSSEIDKLEEEKTKIMQNIRGETQHLQVKKEKLEIELLKLKQTVNTTKSEYDLAKVSLEMSMSNEQNAKEKLDKLEEKIATNKEKIVERTRQVSELEKKIPLTEKSLRNAKDELQHIQKAQHEITDEFNRKKINLSEAHSTMQMSKSRGKILESLFQQKREGNCPGLYGRLGDLGAIDKKYDVAVSTACGPLDNIVVDTVDTAQWCIEFLRAHNIGRGVFIALDKQEHLREHANSKIRTPENVPRLFDLIRVQDEDVKTAFYYALQDTLVCESIDQASRIAYGAQRFRVVTVKGELIETSGTMSGGGRVSRGRMGQSLAADPADVEKLEEHLTALKKKLDSFAPRERSLDGQIDVLQREYSSMRLNFEVFTKELKHLKQELPILVQQLEEQQNIVKSTKSDAKQVKALTEEMNAKKMKFEEASEIAEKFQRDVDEVSAEIDAKSSGKIQTVEKNIKEIRTKFEKCKADIAKLKVAINTSQRNAKKSQNRIADLEQNIKDAETNIMKLKSLRDEMIEDGKKINKCIEEITEQLLSGEEEFSELKNVVDQLTKKENEIKMEKVDIFQTLKNINDNLKQHKTVIQQFERKLGLLNLHEIPDETIEPLKKYSLEEIEAQNGEAFELELQTVENALKNAKPNLGVLEEYKNGMKIYKQRQQLVDEVTNKRNNLIEVKEKVGQQRKTEFLSAFQIIKMKLKEMYQMITLGGDADLDIADYFDPFNEGIVFTVRPPKKSWKSIMHLSGGEKTLASLAFVFALHHYKPSPLYVMDEIDAALDFKNVSIVGYYIKERTKNAQFIVISLRENMFELASTLVGIYKVFDCTQTISINTTGFDQEDSENNQNVENNQNSGNNQDNDDINQMTQT